MADLIDRKAAIDAIARATFDVTISGRQGFHYYKDEFKKAFVAIRDKYIEALKALPPAGPGSTKWKIGHWIDRNAYSMYPVLCSECGGWQSSRSKFCPDCGADMRGEGDG